MQAVRSSLPHSIPPPTRRARRPCPFRLSCVPFLPPRVICATTVIRRMRPAHLQVGVAATTPQRRTQRASLCSRRVCTSSSAASRRRRRRPKPPHRAAAAPRRRPKACTSSSTACRAAGPASWAAAGSGPRRWCTWTARSRPRAGCWGTLLRRQVHGSGWRTAWPHSSRSWPSWRAGAARRRRG
jgi:hypothetical protein